MNMMKWQTGMAGMTVGLALALGATGCKSNANNQPAQVANLNNAPDPCAANLAPVSGTSTPGQTAVLSSSAAAPQSQSGEQYQDQGSSDQQYAPANYDADNDQSAPVEYAQQAPPPLPDYEQPELTEPGYIWTPGYWAWGSEGYYWVPGAWVAPPYQEALWTPGYWGYYGGRYGWHRGYWAHHIGYYGGINYGFGYIGFGYQGGYWNGNQFYYNNAVNHVNVNDVRYVYQRNVPDNNHGGRVSFNGPNGVRVAPRPAEVAVLREQRTPPMQVQQQRVQAAAQNRDNFYAVNHGRPAVAAVSEHLAADRTPPAPIQQHAVAPAQAQRGGFGQPAANQRQEQLNAQHNAQVQQQERTQQATQQRNAQVQQQQQARQQEQQRTQQANEQRQQAQRAQPQARPEARPQEQARPAARPQEQARSEARPQEQARPEARPAAPARPAAQPRPAPRPQEPRPAPKPQEKPKR